MISVDEFRRRAEGLTLTERKVLTEYAHSGDTYIVAKSLINARSTIVTHLHNASEKLLFDAAVPKRNVLLVAHMWRSGLAEEWENACF